MQFAKITTVGIFSTLIILAGCKEDPDEAANKLFVEASSAVAAYKKGADDDASPKDLQAHLETAIADLNKITTQYPSASAAVKVASTPKDSDIYLPRLEEELAKTKRAVYCHDNPADLSCKFVPLIEKQIAAFDPNNIGPADQFLIFTLAATDRYDDLTSILDQLKSVENISGEVADAMIVFCLAYGHPDVIDKINALIVASGRAEINDKERASVERLPEIIRSSEKIPVPEINPHKAAKDHVIRMLAFLQNGDDKKSQDEMMEIYNLVYPTPDNKYLGSIAEEVLKLTTWQFNRWGHDLESAN